MILWQGIRFGNFYLYNDFEVFFVVVGSQFGVGSIYERESSEERERERETESQ